MKKLFLILTLFFSLVMHANFTLSVKIVTQTGKDVDLMGLSSIAGETKLHINGSIPYYGVANVRKELQASIVNQNNVESEKNKTNNNE